MESSINNRALFASAVHTALAEEVELNDTTTAPRLQIYHAGSKGCPYLAKTIPMQRYNPKKPLQLADHRDDHPVVSLAYFLISEASTERQSFKEKTIKPWMRPKESTRYVLGSHNVRTSHKR